MARTPEQIMAELLSRPLIAPKPGSADIAKFILAQGSTAWAKDTLSRLPTQSVADKKKGQSKSLLLKVIDILSRPNYAMAEYTRAPVAAFKEGERNPFELQAKATRGLVSGLAGTKKTTFSDVLEEQGVENPILKHGLGFVGDVALDPTTYAGIGGVKQLLKLAKPAKKAVGPKAIPDLEKALQSARGDILSQAGQKDLVQQVRLGITPTFKYPTEIAKPVPGVVTAPVSTKFPDLSEILGRKTGLSRAPAVTLAEGRARVQYGKDFAEYMKKARERKKPGADLLQNVTKAEDIVEGVAKGDISGVALMAPKTPLIAAKAASETERIIANKVANDYAASILSVPSKFGKRLKAPAINNPAQQANLYEKLQNAAADILGHRVKNPRSPKMLSAKSAIAHRMLREAEKVLDEKGFTPSFWDGSRIKLSEVIDELGGPMAVKSEHMPQVVSAFKNRNPNLLTTGTTKIRQAIENIRARKAAEDARAVHFTVDLAAKKAAIADEVLSPPKVKEFLKQLAADSRAVTLGQGASKASAAATGALVRDVLRMNTPLPQKAIDSYANQIIDDMSKGLVSKGHVFVIDKITKAIDEALGVNSKELGKTVGNNKAVETFGARIATWYGNKDLRPTVLDNMATARANASKRSETWQEVERKHSKEEIGEAFNLAKGLPVPNVSDRVQNLSDMFKDSMERLFMTSGLRDEAFKASTVATRSGLMMKDINRALGRMHSPFRFTAKKVEDELGEIHDYSKGIDWLKSWETAKIKDPITFMYQMDLAVEQTVKEYALYDEIIARWGSKVKVGEYQRTLDPEKYPRFNGAHFSNDIHSQIEKVVKELHSFQKPDSQLVRHYDQVLRMWKAGVTKYAPSHHIRNIIGDTFNSWLAGVNSPTPYRKASKVIWSQRSKYNDLEDTEKLVGRDAIAAAMTKPGDSIVTTKSGIQLTADQIYIAAHNHGLLQTVHVIEDIFGEVPFDIKPFGGRVSQAASKVSENREHFVRLAHFIDHISKSKESSLKKVFADASHEVRKWHPDNMDMTDFERKVMRRVVPFYSWTRKEIPLLVEALMTNPGKVLAYPKGMEALQGMLGIENVERSQPFPTDQLFPQWIRDKGVGPLAKPGELSGLTRQEPEGYSLVNPSTPFMDIASQFSNPVKGIAAMTTPAFRIPAELATGKEVVGGDINRGNIGDYATEQIPIAAILSRITNVGLGGTTERGEREGLGSSQALINYLTAAGILGTGPYRKQAKYEEGRK